jgi:hypothetical protein
MPTTNYLENAILNATLRNTSYTSPTTVYSALYSTAPTPSTGGTELSGNGYSRVSSTFSSPSGGITSNSADITFGPATGNWATVVAFGIVDASSGGNLLYYTSVNGRNVKSGDSLTYTTGNVVVTLS